MDPKGTVSVGKAAELLGLTIAEAYDLVFTKAFEDSRSTFG